MTGTDAQATFVERLERHRGIIATVAQAYCRNRTDRDDLIQEILIQLWRAYPRFDGRSSFSTWTYRIAVNVAISSYRREMRATAASAATLERQRREAASRRGESGDDRLTLALEFVEGLDELNRALMVLYLEELPYAEIASVLGISETNVATKISRLKQRLRREVAARTAGKNGDERGS